MAETIVIESLKTAFAMEISNKIVCKRNQIVVLLPDGTKAKICAKNMK